MAGEDQNIKLEAPGPSAWDSADPALSLQKVRQAVELEAQNAIEWYWRSKRSRRIASQGIRFSALTLTAAGGISPIFTQVLRSVGAPNTPDSGPLASLFIATAAALFGLDKAFGFSTGWTRYVLTVTSITTLLHEFRMDWVALSAAAGTPPTTEQQATMIQRAKEFVSTARGMVMQETKDWAAEFQNSTVQMEKDLKSQFDALKAQVDKERKLPVA